MSGTPSRNDARYQRDGRKDRRDTQKCYGVVCRNAEQKAPDHLRTCQGREQSDADTEAALKKAGVVAASDEGLPVQDSRVMMRAMETCLQLDLPILVHCEDLSLSQGGCMNDGATSAMLGLPGIPRSAEEIGEMKALTHKVNAVLKPLFAAAGIDLVDYKLEFGHPHDAPRGPLVLGDEFTPDGCRLWDATTREKMDKDRFRRDLGNVIEKYIEVGRRLGVAL